MFGMAPDVEGLYLKEGFALKEFIEGEDIHGFVFKDFMEMQFLASSIIQKIVRRTNSSKANAINDPIFVIAADLGA